MKFAILLVIVVAMAGLTLGAFSSYISRRALDSARRENEQLRTRQQALVADAQSLGERATATLEHGRRITRSAGRDRDWLQEQRMPSADAGNEAIIAWISARGAQLESLAVELSDFATKPAMKQASRRDHFGTAASPDNDSPEAKDIQPTRSRMAGSA
ncbi:MAG: hypothetical protein ACSLFQ_17170 [Thermoanaerobaculia bacterium]